MLLACLHLSWAWTPGPVILLQCSDRVLQWCRSHDLRPTVMCIGPLVLVLRSQQRSVFPFLICGAGCPPAGLRAVRYPLGTCHPAAAFISSCLPPPPLPRLPSSSPFVRVAPPHFRADTLSPPPHCGLDVALCSAFARSAHCRCSLSVS